MTPPTPPPPGVDVCHECDRRIANERDYKSINPAVEVTLCWRLYNGECRNEKIDWRALAKKQDAELRHLRERVKAADARDEQKSDAALWLINEGYLDGAHDEDCPQDDTCECVGNYYACVLVGDKEPEPVELERREKKRAAYDATRNP